MWVPPKDASREFANSMLRNHGLLASKCASWQGVVEEHRESFQQVREIEQYSVEMQLSRAERQRLQRAALHTLPWFVALSLGGSYASSIAASVALSFAPPLLVCDPAFVAEMPGSEGMVLKIGHFDEIGGVTHVEI